MTEIHDFATVRPEELIDALADGPRHGQFNPNPEEVQTLLAEIHADDGIAYSYEQEEHDRRALQVYLDGDIPF
jgi:hypothetical protein